MAHDICVGLTLWFHPLQYAMWMFIVAYVTLNWQFDIR
jgi:hypothetical protein